MIHRNGYIDFLKGISIFFVILTHNLPYAAKMLLLAPYWMYLAVPIFLAIQVYHISKRDNKYIYYTKEYIIKLFSNVIIPYVMTQLLVFAFQYIIEGKVSEDKLLLAGVGAYYIYIYIYTVLFYRSFACTDISEIGTVQGSCISIVFGCVF